MHLYFVDNGVEKYEWALFVFIKLVRITVAAFNDNLSWNLVQEVALNPNFVQEGAVSVAVRCTAKVAWETAPPP